jgi:ornithine cyclodeaminase/alanine dehydrogenase-like protein (mu-crystallin family)
MRVITRSEVERLLPIAECIEAMRRAMLATSRGEAVLPIRQYMDVPNAPGRLAIMPGALADPGCFGIKLVAKYERAPSDPLGSHVGMVLLFDSASGVPTALIEGSALTAIRTAAASALATDLLARRDARRLAVIGTGEQARRHIDAMRAVRAIDHIAVWGRDSGRAEAFCAQVRAATGLVVAACPTVAAAAADADIICTATAAKVPVLFGKDLKPGQHVNLVGAAIASSAEADSEVVRRSRFYVDHRVAAMAAAGELIGAIAAGVVGEEHVVAEIGEVIADPAKGRRSASDITVYKSLGIAAQDLAAAHFLLEQVEAEGAAVSLDLLA